MMFIAHRANLNGPNKNQENNPKQVFHILKNFPKLQVEVDLWRVGKRFYFGHDKPQYNINNDDMEYFLNDYHIWFHCKNAEALTYLKYIDLDMSCNYFWHQNDDYTFTMPNNNFIWTYPGKQLVPKSICVLPETVNNYTIKDLKNRNCYGICSDFIFNYYKKIKGKEL